MINCNDWLQQTRLLFLKLKYFTWKYSSCEANVCIFGYTPERNILSNLIYSKDYRICVLFNNLDILIDVWYIDNVQQLMDHQICCKFLNPKLQNFSVLSIKNRKSRPVCICPTKFLKFSVNTFLVHYLHQFSTIMQKRVQRTCFNINTMLI